MLRHFVAISVAPKEDILSNASEFAVVFVVTQPGIPNPNHVFFYTYQRRNK